MNLPNPTIAEIINAIEKSGYLLEQKICPIIEKFDYLATPNEQYEDQDTGKSREIDVHALKLYSLYRDYFDDIFQSVLLFECKTNSLPVVFFSQKNVTSEYGLGNIIIEGYPSAIYNNKEKYDDFIYDHFNFDRFHHNFNVEWISRQFSKLQYKVLDKRSKNEKIEWELSHEGLYESIESLTKATFYFSKKFVDGVEVDKSVYLGIFYPILVFSGKIYDCRILKRTYKIDERNHLVFYKSIQSKNVSGELHIDVVQVDYLPRLLEIIEADNDKIVSILKRNRKKLLEQVKMDMKKRK